MENNINLQKVLFKTKNLNGEEEIRLKKNPFLLFQFFKEGLLYVKCSCGELFSLTIKEAQNINIKKRCPYCEKRSYDLKKQNFKDEIKEENFTYTLGSLFYNI